jgi:hypothetical protein
MNNTLVLAESKEEEARLLKDINSREDSINVFVKEVLDKSPTIYILVNITLLIWLAQTIFSSNL